LTIFAKRDSADFDVFISARERLGRWGCIGGRKKKRRRGKEKRKGGGGSVVVDINGEEGRESVQGGPEESSRSFVARFVTVSRFICTVSLFIFVSSIKI